MASFCVLFSFSRFSRKSLSFFIIFSLAMVFSSEIFQFSSEFLFAFRSFVTFWSNFLFSISSKFFWFSSSFLRYLSFLENCLIFSSEAFKSSNIFWYSISAFSFALLMSNRRDSSTFGCAEFLICMGVTLNWAIWFSR